MIFDPEMLAGLQKLSSLKAEDLTAEQREAVAVAIAKIDRFQASVAETMKEPFDATKEGW